VLNLLEALKTQNERVRRRLVATIGFVASGRPLLPWPYELLRQAGAIIAGRLDGIRLQPSGYEWILEHPDDLTTKQLDSAREFLEKQESAFTKMHDEARPLIQRFLKQHHLKGSWRVASEFLDQEWTTKAHLDTYIERIWNRLNLPSDAPVDQVLENEMWRLFFDGQGIGAFERAISEQPPKRAQQMDLLQLIYLGGAQRRMIASDDAGTLRAAMAVLHGRYRRARAVHISQLTV
jgi:hypothetical protein